MNEARPVPGFPEYMITPCGVVFRDGEARASRRDRRGYARVQLWRNNKNHGRFLHRLLYEAFVGPIPAGMSVCHNDGNPRNNALSNLRVDTHAGNMADKEKHGTLLRGATHPLARMDEKFVSRVKSRLKEVWGNRSRVLLVAREFALTKSTVAEIVKGRNWRHVDPQLNHPTPKPIVHRDFGPMIADYSCGMNTREVAAKYRCDRKALMAAIRKAGVNRNIGDKRAALRQRGWNVELWTP